MTTLHEENIHLYVFNACSILPEQRCTICKGLFNLADKELVYYTGTSNLVTSCVADYYGHETSNPFKYDPDTLTVIMHDGCFCSEMLPSICVTDRRSELHAVFNIPKFD